MKRSVLFAFLMMFCLNVLANHYTVGVEAADYSPFYKSDGKAYSGYARELLDDFGNKSGHVFTYVPLPVSRLHYEFAVKKSLDFKFPDNAQWALDVKKDAKIIYSNAAVLLIEGLMVLPENKERGIASIKTIVTQRGFTPSPFLDQIKSGKIALSEANTSDAAIGMVKSSRADAAYLGVVVANYILTNAMKEPGALVFDHSLPSIKSSFALATIKHPDVIKQFNDYLARNKEVIAALKIRYRITE